MTANAARPSPRPGPPPNGGAPKRTAQPLTPDQYIRSLALRVDGDAHRNRDDGEEPDAEILATAVRFAEYIRTGKTDERN